MGLQNELHLSQQPQHLRTWLLGAFCSEFNFESISRTRILISGLDSKIDPKIGISMWIGASNKKSGPGEKLQFKNRIFYLSKASSEVPLL